MTHLTSLSSLSLPPSHHSREAIHLSPSLFIVCPPSLLPSPSTSCVRETPGFQRVTKVAILSPPDLSYYHLSLIYFPSVSCFKTDTGLPRVLKPRHTHAGNRSRLTFPSSALPSSFPSVFYLKRASRVSVGHKSYRPMKAPLPHPASSIIPPQYFPFSLLLKEGVGFQRVTKVKRQSGTHSLPPSLSFIISPSLLPLQFPAKERLAGFSGSQNLDTPMQAPFTNPASL